MELFKFTCKTEVMMKNKYCVNKVRCSVDARTWFSLRTPDIVAKVRMVTWWVCVLQTGRSLCQVSEIPAQRARLPMWCEPPRAPFANSRPALFTFVRLFVYQRSYLRPANHHHQHQHHYHDNIFPNLSIDVS